MVVSIARRWSRGLEEKKEEEEEDDNAEEGAPSLPLATTKLL